MARPIKKGIDYFPMDVVLSDRIRLIEAEFGLTGFAVVVKLFQKIYGECGYYCEWKSEVALLFSHDVGLGRSAVSEIVTASIRRGIFDRQLYDKYRILTSVGIQKRYFDAVSRRNEVEVIKEYLLINATQNIVNVDINAVNVYINSENVDDNPQSKGKKSKGEKSKVKEIGSLSFKKPTIQEMERYIADKKYNVDAKECFNYYNDLDWVRSNGKEMKSWKHAVYTFHINAKRWGNKGTNTNSKDTNSNASYDIDDFISASQKTPKRSKL